MPTSLRRTNCQKGKLVCRPYNIPLIYPLCLLCHSLCTGCCLPKLYMVLARFHTVLTYLHLNEEQVFGYQKVKEVSNYPEQSDITNREKTYACVVHQGEMNNIDRESKTVIHKRSS